MAAYGMSSNVQLAGKPCLNPDFEGSGHLKFYDRYLLAMLQAVDSMMSNLVFSVLLGWYPARSGLAGPERPGTITPFRNGG